MEAWIVWMIAALVLFIIEIFTSGFAVICVSIGSLGAGISALAGCGIKTQLIWFAVLTLVAFVAIRPILVRLFFRKPDIVKPSGIYALRGREAVVSETIDLKANTGRVAVDGDDWRAVSIDKEDVIEVGERVLIMSVNSTIVTVMRIP